MSPRIEDHHGNAVTHGRETVNGVRLHYVTAGSGEPLVLLHGVPKSSWYWSRIILLLTPHDSVIVPDIRGFGDSFRPRDGYDMRTFAEDIAQLTSALGHEQFFLHGEDWGAAFAYALTADHRGRVRKLSFGEMLLPGFGLEEWSYLTAENVRYVELDCGRSMDLERPKRLPASCTTSLRSNRWRNAFTNTGADARQATHN